MPRMRAWWWVLPLVVAACAHTPLDPGIRHLEQAPTAQASPTPIQLGLPFLANVGLTADQTQQIEAIMKQQWPAPDQTQASQDAQAFQAALQADQVDATQLRELLTKSETDQRAKALKLVDVLQAVRPILTEQQLSQAANALLNPPSPAPDQQMQDQQAQPQQPQQQQPSLTAEQQQLFQATQPAQTDQQAVPKAIATLLQSGDATALTSALTPQRDVATQVDAEVAALASLTADQRRQMFSQAQDQGGASAPQR